MKLSIHPLTKERTGDYFAFFDRDAFLDHQDWSWCYCTFYHMDTAMEKEMEQQVTKQFLRGMAARLIEEGTLTGYLAYDDDAGKVIGWCNAGPKGSFRRLHADDAVWPDPDGDRTLAIVCFIVAESYRRQGVARAMLQRVQADAKAAGYAYIEAYPVKEDADCYVNYHGHAAMYRAQGFEPHKEAERYTAVRKTL